MKFSIALSLVIATTTGSTAERSPCTTYADLDFTSCDMDSIRAVVQAEVDGLTDCRNNANQEIKALTGTASNNEAKPIIVEECLSSLTPCLASLDDIVYTTCDMDNITTATATALQTAGGTCGHDATTELMLLTDISESQDLRQEMRLVCQQNQVSCLDNLDNVAWTSGCDLDGARAAVEAALIANGGDCPHDVTTEIKILTGHRFDGQDANQAIKAICDANRSKCIDDLSTLEWTTCSDGDISDVIEAALTTVDCPHNTRTEMFLHTNEEFPASRNTIALQCQEEIELCVEWDNVELDGCDQITIMDYIEEQMLLVADCPRTVLEELMVLTGANNTGQAQRFVKLMCREAWNTVAHSSPGGALSFRNGFLGDYNEGGTYLNTETGNFQGGALAGYPTSEQSDAGGKAINAFYENGAETTILEPIKGVRSCEYQSMMCCFSRDRQGGDANGDCAADDCDDKDPGDNSDLCGREDEGNIHCHGLAWSDDENDVTAQFMFNNWFFVSMYDHLYTRGYVEKVIDATAMCGCIEDMPVVSRADCTQTDVDVTFTFNTDALNLLSATTDGAVSVEFNQCEGAGGNNNDLQAYTEQLVEDGKMDSSVYQVIRGTLQGADGQNNCV